MRAIAIDLKMTAMSRYDSKEKMLKKEQSESESAKEKSSLHLVTVALAVLKTKSF